MLSKHTLFYDIYSKFCCVQLLTTPLSTYHCNGGQVPQNNPAYRLKTKFDLYTGLYDKGHFYKAQKCYWTLNRVVRKLSLKRKVKHNMDEDLCGSPLVPRFTIELLQDNCIYKFSIHDLMHILKTSLLSVTNNWYPCPKMPRNPFTNKEFDKTHLYSIYAFAFAYCPRLLINQLILAFLKADFDVSQFSNQNQTLLLHNYIETLVAKDTHITVDIVADILLMIKIYSNPFAPIEIQSTIYKKTLFSVFRPYLRLYYKTKLLCCNKSEKMLRRGLRNFALFNPLFGHTYYDYATKKIEVDTRCLSCGDFTEDNCLFDTFAKIRGGSETLCLPPIQGVYYFPKKIHVLEKTVLRVLPNGELFELEIENDAE